MRAEPRLRVFFLCGVKMKTAILVDGGYYRKLAKHYAGEKTPLERAAELESYCRKHLRNRDVFTIDEKKQRHYQYSDLYRIFYYDCEPVAKLARREGIDFILDPMGKTVNSNLFDHIDGLRSNYKSLQKEECETEE